jgi:hypothetical protein
LALSDAGTPCFNESLAAQFSSLSIPTFACTPDLFPSLMAATIQRQDISSWAATNQIVVH